MTLHAPPPRTDADLDRLRIVDLAAARVAVVLWGGLAVVDVWRITGTPSYAAVGGLAVLVMLSSVGMRPLTAVVCAGVAWLLADGFVEHQAGVLRWDGVADLGRLVLLVGAAVLATRVHR